MDISIIICCYNSEYRIKSTLEHLACQNIGFLGCELILVDNNCQDNTVKIALSVWEDCNNPFTLRIEEQKEPGLSHARRKGIYTAKGEIIIFCDDDNWLEKDYIKNAFEIMKSNSKIGVLSGQSRAVSDIEIPTWFYSHYSYYACGVLAMQSGDVTSRMWVWGAGMVLRRELIMKIYSLFSHKLTGRKGQDLSSGEDVEICLWHILSGYKLWYASELSIKHYMSNFRLDSKMAVKQFKEQLQSSKLLNSLNHMTIEYFLWSSSMYKYLFSMLIQLIKLNIFNFLIKFYYLIIFIGILPNQTFIRARKIQQIK